MCKPVHLILQVVDDVLVHGCLLGNVVDRVLLLGGLGIVALITFHQELACGLQRGQLDMEGSDFLRLSCDCGCEDALPDLHVLLVHLKLINLDVLLCRREGKTLKFGTLAGLEVCDHTLQGTWRNFHKC